MEITPGPLHTTAGGILPIRRSSVRLVEQAGQKQNNRPEWQIQSQLRTMFQ